jgi:hypothetical protein
MNAEHEAEDGRLHAPFHTYGLAPKAARQGRRGGPDDPPGMATPCVE